MLGLKQLHNYYKRKRLNDRAGEYFDLFFNKHKTVYPRTIDIHPEPFHRILVLSPHADDETFGCGGTLFLHTHAGHKIKVISFLDNVGSVPRFDIGNEQKKRMRYEEFETAMKILFVQQYCSFGLSTEQLQQTDAAASLLKTELIEYLPDLLYVPSIIDNHYDHRILHQITYKVFTEQSHITPAVRMYEVWSSVYPNLLVDISSVIHVKIQAMRAFKSQADIINYEHHILGLNAYRAISLGEKKKFAEGFLETSMKSYLDSVRTYIL